MKKQQTSTLAILTAVSITLSSHALADTSTHTENTIRSKTSEGSVSELKARVDRLEKELDERMNLVADAVEAQTASSRKQSVHMGGYGEMHYNHLDADDEDFRQLDMHRAVIFFGYDFSDKARFVSELEVEHIVVSAGSRGAVEVEQAYLEFDVKDNMHLKTGVLLVPVGTINETHEPPTFYGVERPVVETTIIPSTWYVSGISLSHTLSNGLSYELMVSEGLKTEDPTSDPSNDPFDLKQGKQKASFADAYDLAITGRLAYRGISGLEIAGYAQFQPDLDQSAQTSYAESATLMGGHIIYQWHKITTKALYARWTLDGDAATDAGKDIQEGAYVEVDWKPLDHWGVFARQSAWSQVDGVDAQQTDLGLNFYPVPGVVVKADYQIQNDDAGNTNGFNLGVGYQF